MYCSVMHEDSAIAVGSLDSYSCYDCCGDTEYDVGSLYMTLPHVCYDFCPYFPCKSTYCAICDRARSGSALRPSTQTPHT